MTLIWIPFTIFAAFMQSWRNAMQRQLRQHVSTAGATLARFIIASPLAAIYLFFLYQLSPQAAIPQFSPLFWRYILIASITQIFATALMVMLFQRRNYAIGVGLAKSEAVIAAALGALFFAAPLSFVAWLGVIVGVWAVWLMSRAIGQNTSWKNIVIGLGSGLFFALCTLYIREASIILQANFATGYLIAAAWVLLWVIFTQTLILLIWLIIKEPHTLKQLWSYRRLTASVSLFGFLGSIGWFTAMSVQSVALVKTLGQVEVLFTLAISVWWFKEKLARTDYWGLGLIVLGALLVILA